MEDQGSAAAVPEDQGWFWSPAWQREEAEIDRALRRGERGKMFPNGEEFLRSLADEAGLDLEEIKRRADARGAADT
ncbi:hypothetical protein [Kitasatospora sp. NPDC057500]|uniref:hypothetical protein n=1 Tax=Kitasatospora sp. NPDC057500 TaxID=3346151 RepID=UPI0036D0799B